MRGILSFAFMLCLASAVSAEPPAAGSYSGTWTAESGEGGNIVFTLVNEGGKWNATAEFTMGDTKVPCTVKRLEVTDGKLILAYDFSLQGYELRSTLTGSPAGKSIKGTYATTAGSGGDQVSAGRFEATAN